MIGNISKNYLVVLVRNRAFFRNEINFDKKQETEDRKKMRESFGGDYLMTDGSEDTDNKSKEKEKEIKQNLKNLMDRKSSLTKV